MWLIFKNGVLRQLEALDDKIKKLHSWGEPFSYTYDFDAMRAAANGGEISFKGLVDYEKAAPFIVYGNPTTAYFAMLKGMCSHWLLQWLLLNLPFLAGFDSPAKFFTEIDRGLLRSIWGADDSEWIELPGPACWWPDDPSWYSANGFEVRVELAPDYRKGLDALNDEFGKPDWEKYLLHDNAPYDVVWNKFFGFYGI